METQVFKKNSSKVKGFLLLRVGGSSVVTSLHCHKALCVNSVAAMGRHDLSPDTDT